MDEEKPATAEAISVALRLEGLEDLRPEFANNLQVNFDADTFQVVFSRFMQPLLLTDADRERIKQIDSFPLQPVARVVLPPRLAKQVAEVMTDLVQRYEERFGQIVDIKGTEQDDEG